MTSDSAFRRWSGNCFRREWDAIAFLIPVVLLLVAQIVVYTDILKLPLWPFWLIAFAFPAFLIVRNIPERHTYFAARAKLEKNGFANADAALFRMTSDEIRAIARTPGNEIETFLQERSGAELRWQILIHRFQHRQTELPHENSIPE